MLLVWRRTRLVQMRFVGNRIGIPVKSNILNLLQISLNLDNIELQPGGKLAIDINVDCPNSDVALLAVDKGLYILNNENRLSRDKVRDGNARQYLHS